MTRPTKATQRAKAIIEECNVDQLPVPIDDIVRHFGLNVVTRALPNDTSAVIVREPSGRRTIGINANHPPTRRRFSLAHELGHALLHLPATPPQLGDAVVDRPLEILYRDDIASEGTDKREVEANAFAAELLMPADLVKPRFVELIRATPNRTGESALRELANECAVSRDAIRYRLINLELIDPY